MEVSGQFQALTTLPWGKELHHTHIIGRLSGPLGRSG
jgi:hypothetical protein